MSEMINPPDVVDTFVKLVRFRHWSMGEDAQTIASKMGATQDMVALVVSFDHDMAELIP